MSKLGKLRKNAENFRLQEFYNKMTPEQYQKGIQIAIERTKEDLLKDYKYNLIKLQKQCNEALDIQAGQIIDTISIELIYELANQMNAFDEEDEEIKEQIIAKVQEIYINTMKAIEKYSKYKNDKQASREYKKKKTKVLKMFNLNYKNS